jgi:aspartate ammonia-lyase
MTKDDKLIVLRPRIAYLDSSKVCIRKDKQLAELTSDNSKLLTKENIKKILKKENLEWLF